MVIDGDLTAHPAIADGVRLPENMVAKRLLARTFELVASTLHYLLLKLRGPHTLKCLGELKPFIINPNTSLHSTPWLVSQISACSFQI